MVRQHPMHRIFPADSANIQFTDCKSTDFFRVMQSLFVLIYKISAEMLSKKAQVTSFLNKTSTCAFIYTLIRIGITAFQASLRSMLSCPLARYP